MAELVNKIHEQTFDNLMGGLPVPLITKNVVIKGGAGFLKKGTVLGKFLTGDHAGKHAIVDSTKTDGTQLADVILSTDINVGTADVVAQSYRQGSFNRNALIVATGDTVDKHEEELRKLNIILTEVL